VAHGEESLSRDAGRQAAVTTAHQDVWLNMSGLANLFIHIANTFISSRLITYLKRFIHHCRLPCTFRAHALPLLFTAFTAAPRCLCTRCRCYADAYACALPRLCRILTRCVATHLLPHNIPTCHGAATCR